MALIRRRVGPRPPRPRVLSDRALLALGLLLLGVVGVAAIVGWIVLTGAPR